MLTLHMSGSRQIWNQFFPLRTAARVDFLLAQVSPWSPLGEKAVLRSQVTTLILCDNNIMMATHSTVIKSEPILKTRETTDMRTIERHQLAGTLTLCFALKNRKRILVNKVSVPLGLGDCFICLHRLVCNCKRTQHAVADASRTAPLIGCCWMTNRTSSDSIGSSKIIEFTTHIRGIFGQILVLGQMLWPRSPRPPVFQEGQVGPRISSVWSQLERKAQFKII